VERTMADPVKALEGSLQASGPSHHEEKSDVDTLANEERRHNSRHSGDNGLSRTISGGVDIEKAEHEFAELSKQLSGISQHSRRLSKSQSRSRASHHTDGDVEKSGGSEDSEEPWDLETTLRGGQAAESAAGIKSKKIGVFALANST
jgi:ATP-binding cassette subfamily G (WHITE) protein 2 (SNQ2)